MEFCSKSIGSLATTKYRKNGTNTCILFVDLFQTIILTLLQVFFTDILHRRRLQTLQSVDDAIHKVLNVLRSINELHNTYVIMTSDHGYHLG